MSASPKSKRTPPVRKFEDYIIKFETKTEDSGLYPINSSTMERFPLTTDYEFTYYSDGGYYLFDLGFDFLFDQISYKKVWLTSNGLCILVDPNNESTVAIDTTQNNAGTGYGRESTTIRETFLNDSKHVVLAPWFTSADNVNFGTSVGLSGYMNGSFVNINNFAWSSLVSLPSGLYLWSDQEIRDVSEGKIAYPNFFDSTGGGIRCYRGTSSRLGKYFLARYSIINSEWILLNFDVVIYQNGVMEFRYGKAIDLKQDYGFSGVGTYVENVAVGIFCTEKKYRDFSPILKQNANDSRSLFRNGGSIYDGSYVDVDSYNSAKYTCTLNHKGTWRDDSIFKITPPVNKEKKNRSINNVRDSISFVEQASSTFDDQKSVNIGNDLIQYPAMLPVSAVTSHYVSSHLFQSGSIEIYRTTKHGLYDSALYDSIIESKGRK